MLLQPSSFAEQKDTEATKNLKKKKKFTENQKKLIKEVKEVIEISMLNKSKYIF